MQILYNNLRDIIACFLEFIFHLLRQFLHFFVIGALCHISETGLVLPTAIGVVVRRLFFGDDCTLVFDAVDTLANLFDLSLTFSLTNGKK